MTGLKSGDVVYLKGVVRERDNDQVVRVYVTCGEDCGNINLFVSEKLLTTEPSEALVLRGVDVLTAALAAFRAANKEGAAS